MKRQAYLLFFAAGLAMAIHVPARCETLVSDLDLNLADTAVTLHVMTTIDTRVVVDTSVFMDTRLHGDNRDTSMKRETVATEPSGPSVTGKVRSLETDTAGSCIVLVRGNAVETYYLMSATRYVAKGKASDNPNAIQAGQMVRITHVAGEMNGRPCRYATSVTVLPATPGQL